MRCPDIREPFALAFTTIIQDAITRHCNRVGPILLQVLIQVCQLLVEVHLPPPTMGPSQEPFGRGRASDALEWKIFKEDPLYLPPRVEQHVSYGE